MIWWVEISCTIHPCSNTAHPLHKLRSCDLCVVQWRGLQVSHNQFVCPCNIFHTPGLQTIWLWSLRPLWLFICVLPYTGLVVSMCTCTRILVDLPVLSQNVCDSVQETASSYKYMTQRGTMQDWPTYCNHFALLMSLFTGLHLFWAGGEW